MTVYQISPTCQIKTLAEIYERYFGDKSDGFFVDVGAGDGISFSNTSCFPSIGWGGLMIEPSPPAVRACIYLYAKYPNVRTLELCVGNRDGEIVKLFTGAVNTTKPDMIPIYNDALSAGLREDKFIECRSMTLNTLLRENNVPVGFDVLSIDVEGAEMSVLNGFDYAFWKPKMTIIETHARHENRSMDVASFDISIYFGNRAMRIYEDSINSIYVESAFKWSMSDSSAR